MVSRGPDGRCGVDRLTAPFDKEVLLATLLPGPFPNSFATLDGIALNGNYVNFLRKVVPLLRTRLRTKGKADPVVIAIDGNPVGIVMPLAPAK